MGVTGQRSVGVAVSGGTDSLALLHVTWLQAQPWGLRVVALHVHHGLQAAAQHWPGLIEAECRRWHQAHPTLQPVVCRHRRLQGQPGPGDSVEEWAREGRWAALAEMAREEGLDLVLLAQHRRDQAETFLLQALRGAGPQGLAAMAPRLKRHGVWFARPWLNQDRAAIEAHVAMAGLRPVQDPSNDDPRWARNRLRLMVWPHLQQAFAQAEQALAMAARQCARSLPTMEEGARSDWRRCTTEPESAPSSEQAPAGPLRLAPDAWAGLPPARRAAVLRWWCRGQGWARPPASLIERVAQESAQAASLIWPVPGGGVWRWYRGVLTAEPATLRLAASGGPVVPEGASNVEAADALVVFQRAGWRRVPAWGGRLRLRRTVAGEAGWPGAEPPVRCVLRERRGSDQFQAAPRSQARSLKKQFQAMGVPAWARGGPVVCDEQGQLLFVPGLGMDARPLAPQGGWVFEWSPDPDLE